MSYRAILAFTAVAFSTLAHAQEWLPMPWIRLGQGYDSATGQVRSDCLAFDEQRTLKNPDAQQYVGSGLTEITSSSQLIDALTIDASASANVKAFSASAAVSLLAESTISTFSTNLMVFATIEKYYTSVANQHLKPEYEKMAVTDPSLFLRTCGDRYIASVLWGGEFAGLVMVSTFSQSDHEHVTATLKANYASLAEANGRLDLDSRSIFSSHSNEVKGYALGSSGSKPLPSDPDSMKTRYIEFANEINSTQGAPIRVMPASYAIQTKSNVDYQRLSDLAHARWDWLSAQSEVDYILAHQDQFYMTPDWIPRLRELRARCADTITRLDQAATACSRGQCAGAPTPDAYDVRFMLPIRYKATCTNITVGGSCTRFMPWVPLPAPQCQPGEPDQIIQSISPLTTACADKGDDFPVKAYIDAAVDVLDSGKKAVVNTTVKMVPHKNIMSAPLSTMFGSCAQRTTQRLIHIVPSDGAPRNADGCYIPNVDAVTPNRESLAGTGSTATIQLSGTGLIDYALCSAVVNDNHGCWLVGFRPFNIQLHHEEERLGPPQPPASPPAAWANVPGVQGGIVAAAEQRARDAKQDSKVLKNVRFPPRANPAPIPKFPIAQYKAVARKPVEPAKGSGKASPLLVPPAPLQPKGSH